MNGASPPLASIGICTYNRADGYLREALASAVRQEYPNLEIVVSDNASTDDTEDVVRGFDDPRIRYFKQERNLGVNGNFNFCLHQARGDYFLLLHDDDLIDSDFIDVCMKAVAERPGAGVIRTGTRVIDGQGRVRSEKPNQVDGRSTGGMFLGWFRGETGMYFCSTMYATEKFVELGGFGTRTDLFLDVAAVAQLDARFGRVDVPDVKASFRRHDSNNGTAQRVEDWCEDSEYLLDLICELAPEDAEAIRREGLRFFSRKNYRQAQSIPSIPKRLRTYWMVYHRFDRSYPPWSFIRSRSRSLRRSKRALSRLTGRRADRVPRQ